MKNLILILAISLFSIGCTKETIRTVVVEKEVKTFEDFERNNAFGGYNVYTALISQTGTNAPTVKILDNNLGNIVWSRNGIGEYVGMLNGVFTLNKTWMIVNQYADFNYSFYYVNNDNIVLDVLAGDGKLNDISIEIRVYY